MSRGGDVSRQFDLCTARHTQRVGADDAAQRRDRRVGVAAVVVRVRHDGVAPAPLAGPERRAIEPLLAGD